MSRIFSAVVAETLPRTVVILSPLTIDGVLLSIPDIVLFTAQDSQRNNGLYYVGIGAMCRLGDQPIEGDIVKVTHGTCYQDTYWACTRDSGGSVYRGKVSKPEPLMFCQCTKNVADGLTGGAKP